MFSTWLLTHMGEQSSCSGNGIITHGPITQVYGSCTQADIESEYAGRQCTSMSVAACMHWFLCQRFGLLPVDPHMIDVILFFGEILHTKLKNEFKISAWGDGKIAVEELPERMMPIENLFDRTVRFKTKTLMLDVFTTEREFIHFPSLYDHLRLKSKNVPHMMVVTFNDYTMAIFKAPVGHWCLFDSHGLFGTRGSCQEYFKMRACIAVFRELEDLTNWVAEAFGPGVHGNIVELLVEEGRPISRNRPGTKVAVYQMVRVESEFRRWRQVQQIIRQHGQRVVAEGADAGKGSQTAGGPDASKTAYKGTQDDLDEGYVSFMGCRD